MEDPMKESKSDRWKPLPLRREFWKVLPAKLKDGVVLISDDKAEKEDMRNAAQAVLIDYIEEELMRTFESPILDKQKDFYNTFWRVYFEVVQRKEVEAWDNLSTEVDNLLKKSPNAELTVREAAYLTLNMVSRHETMAVSSVELYFFLSMSAQVYETLLKEKYKNSYNDKIFYECLRKNFPKFLSRLIGLDSVIAAVLSTNIQTAESLEHNAATVKEGDLTFETEYDPNFFYLGDDDSLHINPKLMEEIYKYAKENEISEDMIGRTADRGCPVLYASKRDAIIDFAIEELIEQHKKR